MSETPIKVGISGLGRSGWGLHVAALARVRGLFEITAVFDPDPARQQEARDQLDCRAYGSYADLLVDDEIELVVVASPSPHHADDTIAALDAGKH
ncbi:MAG: Gfo/Idh/MocA family oxidoreductase, partial [Anaerolineales bacterium]|nr:Gfo/Idh/MocA family oxidoreductase [Anaerolineales bacterium]